MINDISKVGGLSKAAFNLYKLFKENNKEVKIITGNLDKKNEKYYKFALEDIIDLNLGSVHKISNNKLKLIKWYFNFYKSLKNLNLKNDTIISIETFINFLSILALNKNNKVLATEHSSFKRRKITQILKKKLYFKAHNLVVLTKYDEQLYKEIGIDNVIIIPNFIEISKEVSNLNNYNICRSIRKY